MIILSYEENVSASGVTMVRSSQLASPLGQLQVKLSQHRPLKGGKKRMSLVFAEKRTTKQVHFSAKYVVGVSVVADACEM